MALKQMPKQNKKMADEQPTRQLLYVTDDAPGFLRKKWGRGHRYFDASGATIDKRTLNGRLERLRIPPMWESVWICAEPDGHLQATGYDEKGRKQYLYHPLWQEHRSRHKFDKLPEFGQALPLIRERIAKDLCKRDWPKEKVLALVVSLLDETYVRIGNQAYLKENKTYGLTTLRRKHLSLEGKKAVFCYRAKSGVQQTVSVQNPRLVRLVQQCNELPGHELFRYYEKGTTGGQSISSGDVNQYLKEISGEDFSSKNFRTWGGTVTAVERLEEAQQEVAENPRKDLLATVVKKVAERLGNTEAVCREYYIHPYILEAIESGYLSQNLNRFKISEAGPYGLKPMEQVTLKVLQKQQKEKGEAIEILTADTPSEQN
ncbi:DNA topoisomerase IB [Cesiribacter andamanensis]|uniref:DNA topoisomerase n=1 Tax=Cesiribacter andamanensis AMV16 TaxID=1279009 RepID=M7N2V3_9BACT|nr:DNA topoisomerase IB [Cesiribacter andamanensis]EMR01622.1 Eukaryotic DNA topoisomerase I, catalytic core [Cesiribacter andamanensis AMV16]